MGKSSLMQIDSRQMDVDDFWASEHQPLPTSFVYISSFLPAACESSSPLDAKGQTNIFESLAQIWSENIDVLDESKGF
jgi:hypothetical protein